MDTKQKEKAAPKDKRRNNEKRKEKSRDAARTRRSRETEIFTDLASVLPLPSEQVSQLDKASVMRLAISYLKSRDMVTIAPELIGSEKTIEEHESVFLKSLEGFIFVLSPQGDFVYLSENVSDYLGITQIDLMGQNVFEYSHPCDHDEIKEILSSKTKAKEDTSKSFFVRLKCTLTSKGRSVNLKSATFKVLHCKGHLIHRSSDDKDINQKGKMPHCLIAIGQPIPHPSNIEAPLPKQTFLTKHSLDMKFTHADDQIMTDILGYNSEDLVGKSVYEFHHAIDSDAICSAYKCLFSKGQCETNRYRFLAKRGGYVWVLSQATLIYDKMQKPQSVVCVNYVISGLECEHDICSIAQLSCAKSQQNIKENKSEVPDVVLSPPNETSANVNPPKAVSVTAKLFSSYLEPPPPVAPVPPPRPQTATSKIFAPRTEEMSKGFLTFSDEEPGLTLLKDEPDDLTHLAPVAGDVCVPLDDHPFLSDDMLLDDIFLRDSFGTLLSDNAADPFISYRDSYDPSPQLMSPNLSKNSDGSLPSLNSPSDSLTDEDQMSTFMNLHMDDDPEIKSPYVSMNPSDDLPLLMSDDLMWSNGEKKPSATSSLAQLLCTNKHSLKSNDHGGGLMQTDDVIGYFNEKNQSSWGIKQESAPIIKPELPLNANNKRTNTSSYNSSNKRPRGENKDKVSSELLQQLMSNNHNRGRPKAKNSWMLDSGGQKATCVSQPSESVLMNLLDNQMDIQEMTPEQRIYVQNCRTVVDKDTSTYRKLLRKNSISLLDPEAASMRSLLDLTQQDFDVNAPVNSMLLQGEDLLTALDYSDPPI